jgi:hypothetical protein
MKKFSFKKEALPTRYSTMKKLLPVVIGLSVGIYVCNARKACDMPADI